MNVIDKKHILKKINDKSKIALIADLHFNIFQKNNKFFTHMETMMSNFITLCQTEKVDAAIFLGDIFDTKSSVNTDGLIKVNDMLFALSKVCPVIIIPGNHDLAYFNQSEVSLPANYKHYENIIVVNDLVELKLKTHHFIFLPFTNDIANEIKHLNETVKFDDKPVILFSHFGVTSFKVHDYASDFINNAAAQINFSALKKFSKVFLGHYHGYQTKNNVTYASSPLQSRHGDELFKHGFVIYNLETNTHKFYDNKATPKFITYELTKDNVQEMLKLENHYIRIRITKQVQKELLVMLRQKLMLKNFEVKIMMDIPNQMKLSSIQGWNDITFHDDETLITNFLTKLEEQKKLQYDKIKLLEHLEISLK